MSYVRFIWVHFIFGATFSRTARFVDAGVFGRGAIFRVRLISYTFPLID